jgi:hypothetical protein
MPEPVIPDIIAGKVRRRFHRGGFSWRSSIGFFFLALVGLGVQLL